MCDCIKLSQDALKELDCNTQLIIPIVINFKTGQTSDRLTVGTEKIDSKKRKGPVTIFASYCPFCGVEYPKEEKHV